MNKRRVLFIQLLRIGDVLMSVGVISAYRRQNPDAELHLLVNRQCEQLKGTFTAIDQFHFFDRDVIQTSLGEVHRSVFEGYDRVFDLLESLDVYGFDLVVNLTQNRLSGHLTEAIQAKTKLGLSLSAQGRADFGAEPFRELNRMADHRGAGQTHLVDVFREALDLSVTQVIEGSRVALTETEAGIIEADQIFRDIPQGETVIAVQATTSDLKKNWRLDAFRALFDGLMERKSGLRFLVLGAAHEADRLRPLLASKGVSLAICSLSGAFSVLRRSQLLITLDTSIKHLAALAQTPVVEICLGSSDPYRTGVYQDSAWLISSEVACAPCEHSRPCTQVRHECGDRLSPLVVLQAVENRLGRLDPVEQRRSACGSGQVARVGIHNQRGWQLQTARVPLKNAVLSVAE